MARPREFDEASVVEAAARAFSAAGYGGTTMEALSRATGLGKQSIYNSFGGKRGLFLRALSHDAEAHIERLSAQLAPSSTTPLERIRAHLDTLAAMFSSRDILDSLFTKATVELADHDPEVATAARTAYERLESEYAHCIRSAQEAGEVAAGLDAVELASYFVAVTRGMEVLGGAGVREGELRRIGSTAAAVLIAETP